MVEKTVDSHSLYKEAMYLFVYLLLPVLTVQVLTWPSPSFLYAREIPRDLSSDPSEMWDTTPALFPLISTCSHPVLPSPIVRDHIVDLTASSANQQSDINQLDSARGLW